MVHRFLAHAYALTIAFYFVVSLSFIFLSQIGLGQYLSATALALGIVQR